MQTRSSSKFISESSLNPISTNSKQCNRRRSKQRVKPFSIPIVMMEDNRTMEEMLQAPTEGYGDAIVVPDILAENFETKTGLLLLIQANQFHGLESNNPHDHIRSFNRITSTLKFRGVPNDAIKLMLFSYSLEGAAKICPSCFPPVQNNQNHFNQNQGYNQNQGNNQGKYQNRGSNFNQGNSQNQVFNQNQGRGNNFNQVLTYQAPTHQPQVIKQSNFQAYMKENDAVMKNMQTHMTSFPNSNIELKSMFGQFMKMNTASSSGSCLLPCNTVPNPREDLKAITTRSGVTLAGPSVSPPSPPSKERKLSLHELTSTQMILEHADRSTTRPVGIAEDVFVKVGKFYFPTNFVVVDYIVDPRVPLILWRPFLRTRRALIDVYSEELTLRVDDESITFKVACEEYVQEVLGFSDNSKSSSPTLTSDPIISSSSPSFTLFEGGDFILEEIETFLRTPNDLHNLNDDYYDTEGDILYLENFLNEDPSPNLPPVKTKDLKQVDATMTKPLIEKPPELELKELPSHLDYVFLERTDKLPVIISKELKDEEKSALLKVLKSHKQAIAWRISEIKGTFQRCMMAIFHDMIEKTMEVFMDDFSVFSDSFSSCLSHLDQMLKSNETAKDLWDALERQMRSSEYGEQDQKVAILYEYETFKANEGEQLLDTYLLYLQVINDLKKCGYNKDNCDVNDALGYKKKVVVINSDPLALVAEKMNSANKKQEFVKSDDKKEDKKDDEKKRDMSKIKCCNCKKEGHFAKDCKKAKQNNEFNEQIKVLNEKNADLLDQTKVLKDQLQVKHVVIDTNIECHAKYAKLEEEIYEYMIRYFTLFDNDKQHRKQIVDQEVLFDKMSVELVELDKHEDEVVSLMEKEKAKLKTIESLKSKECDKVENSKVIDPGMFKLSVLQSVSPISMSKTSRDSKNVENLDTFSSVRRPKHSGVIWKKKWLSNTSNVDLSSVSLSN
nr:hypothetical protein [Tanacetum cinerariifolium]